jgi:hypothetical protein
MAHNTISKSLSLFAFVIFDSIPPPVPPAIGRFRYLAERRKTKRDVRKVM